MEKTIEHMPSSLPLPFSAAVRAGSMLYLSGQLGMGAGSNKLVTGGIAAETTQALENIETVLLEAGSSKEKIVRCVQLLYKRLKTAWVFFRHGFSRLLV